MTSKRKYSDTDVHRALEDIQNGATISECARKFGIPRSTLSEKHSGKLPAEHRMGPPTILSSEEEALLVKWIFHVGDLGFPITKEQLLDSVQMLLNKSKRETIFTENRPGRKWYEGFTRRHPKVVEKQCQNLTSARANITEAGLRGWYAEVQRHLANEGIMDILDDPTRIFNMDESGFYLNPKPGKVLARKGQKRVYMKIQGDEKEMITVLIGGNANGAKTPPLVMFPYQRLPSHIVKDMPKNWAFGRSPTGWMTAETFYEYVTNCFYPWLVKNGIVLPIVLFLDGHASHITYHLSEFCREKGIILIALHPNATHLIQAMDVSVFRSMKINWLKAAHNYPSKNNGARITREKFSKELEQVLDNDIKESIVANGFVQTGLYPFNPDALDYSQLIKKQKLDDSDNQNNCMDADDSQSNYFLKQFECQMDLDTLQSFKSSKPEWTGKCEDKSLFDFWRKVGGCVNSRIDSGSELIISDKDVDIEYIDASFEECLELGQIIEIISMDNVTDHKTTGNLTPNDDPSAEYSVPSSSSTGNENHHLVIDNQESTGDSPTKLKDQLETEDAYLNEDICSAGEESITDPVGSNDDTSSSDEEVDQIDTNASNNNVSHIPSGFPKYFQDAMFWPGRPSNTQAKSKPKRQPKDKIPAVLISEDFIKYLKDKDEEKLRLEKEKTERKAEREKKRLQKQKENEEKEKLMMERKLEKQKKYEEKEKEKAERQLEKEARKTVKQLKNEEKKKATVERNKKVGTKKTRKQI